MLLSDILNVIADMKEIIYFDNNDAIVKFRSDMRSLTTEISVTFQLDNTEITMRRKINDEMR